MTKFLTAMRPTAIMLALMVGIGVVMYLLKQPVAWASYAMLTVFYGIVFFIGAYAQHFKKEDSHEDVLVAGRNIPLWVGLCTMAATWIDGTYINGTAEATAGVGLIGVQAPWCYALSLMIGGLVFARPMRRGGYTTMLDPIVLKFGKTVGNIGFLTALSGEVFWTAAVLTTLGMTFSTVIHLDYSTSILISAAITVTYACLGGLWAVAFTDVFQLVFLFLGLYIALPFITAHTGGMEATFAAYSTKMGDKAAFFPPFAEFLDRKWWTWWDITFMAILGGIPWQVYFQRVLSARSERAAVFLSLGAGVLCLFAAFPPMVIGMVGALTDWTSLGIEPPATAAATLPYVIKYLTPGIMATVLLAVLAAAVMTSTDASMVSVSSMWTWNVYLKQIKPTATPADLAKMLKKALIVVGTASALMAISLQQVYALWLLCSDFVFCFLFPLLTTALFDKKANKIGALSGVFVTAILRFGGGEPTFFIPKLIPYAADFPFKTVAMLSGLFTIMLVSRLFKDEVSK
jgi:solute carrier family 5 (high affinity choline transporter), member 7